MGGLNTKARRREGQRGEDGGAARNTGLENQEED